jgi:hypothetical protein
MREVGGSVTRKTMGLAAAAACSLALGGCSGAAGAASQPAPWPVFRDGKVVASWSVDHGRFRVEPTTSEPLIPAAQMAARFAASDVGDTRASRLAWGYGRVTIDKRTADDGTPRFDHMEAWVAVLSGLAHSCSLVRPPENAAAPDREQAGYTILVLARDGTAGVTYTSSQSPCGTRFPPRARPLTEVVSLAWVKVHEASGQVRDSVEVSVEAPACAVDVSPQGTGFDATATERWQVLATRALTGPECAGAGSSRQVTIELLSRTTRELEHGPIGLLQPVPHTSGANLEAAVAHQR